MTAATTIHSALADPSRAALMRHLRAAGADGLDAAELASREGLHRTTVGEHLQVLSAAGLVRGTPERAGRPGRPRIRYRATGADEDGVAMQLLAEGLVDALGTGPAARSAAVSAGARVARRLPDGQGSVQALVDALARLGFDPAEEAAPKPSDTLVRLRRCPFGAVAREHPDVVCGLHLGLMQGLLGDADVAVDDLEPLLSDGTCLARLEAVD